MSCANSKVKQVEIVSKRVEIEQIHPSLPDPILTPSINDDFIFVLTPEVTQRLNEHVADGNIVPYVYMAMTEQGYLTLASWIQDVLRYTKELNRVVRFYRDTPSPGKPDNTMEN